MALLQSGGGEIDLREYVVALSVVCRPSQTLATIQLAFKVSGFLEWDLCLSVTLLITVTAPDRSILKEGGFICGCGLKRCSCSGEVVKAGKWLVVLH